MVSLGALIVLAAEDTMWDGLLIAKLLFAADARAVAWAEKAGAQAEEIGNVNILPADGAQGARPATRRWAGTQRPCPSHRTREDPR